MYRKNGGTIMIYLKRLLYLFLITIIYLIGLITTLTIIFFIPIGIAISFIATGKFGLYFDIIMKHGDNVENIIDKLEEKIFK
jgi:hypothetical protein